MKYPVRLVLILVILISSAANIASYVRTTVSLGIGASIQWNLNNPDTRIVSNGRITYNINSAGSDNLPFSDVENAIMASFQTWEDVPTSSVAFARGPNTSSTSTANDGQLQIFWIEDSTSTIDGLNLAGVLAISRLTNYTSGLRTGEILDASLIFNGKEFNWSVNGATNSADIQDIATHEIGHIIGLGHSPIGGATMFPRSLIGSKLVRSLAEDDRIAVSVAYPVSGFLNSTGTLRGRVRDNTGRNIFGAHVVALNTDGVAVSGALSFDDGTYTVQGLPPGSYTVYAEPLDPVSGAYCSKYDVPGYYATLFTDFQTSADSQVFLSAGSVTNLDITVNRGNADFDSYFVSDSTGLAFRNISLPLAQGTNNVSVGVSGPGIPQGASISFTGSGITILKTYFRTIGSGYTAVYADINISPTAIAGARNIVVTSGNQRTVATGGLEITTGSGTIPGLAVVSSANYFNKVAAESIITAFGNTLATQTATAAGNTLPTSLGGTTVRLRDSVGNERMSPLFFVSPNQINCQVSPGIQIGPASMTVTNGNGVASTVNVIIDSVAPGIFSADSSGSGAAAAVVLRIKQNGAQSYEPAINYDPALKRFTTIPIDLGPSTDQVFLLLFGTGFRFRSNLPTVSIGGVNCQVTYAGRQDSYVGMDQINARIDRSLIGRGLVNVVTVVDGTAANTVTANIK